VPEGENSAGGGFTDDVGVVGAGGTRVHNHCGWWHCISL